MVPLEYRCILLYARKTPLFLSASFFMRNATYALVVQKIKYSIFRRPHSHNDINMTLNSFSLQHFVRTIKVEDYIQKKTTVSMYFLYKLVI